MYCLSNFFLNFNQIFIIFFYVSFAFFYPSCFSRKNWILILTPLFSLMFPLRTVIILCYFRGLLTTKSRINLRINLPRSTLCTINWSINKLSPCNILYHCSNSTKSLYFLKPIEIQFSKPHQVYAWFGLIQLKMNFEFCHLC